MTKERCTCSIKKQSGYTLMTDKKHEWYGYWVHDKCLNPRKGIRKEKKKIPTGRFFYAGAVAIDESLDNDD